MATLIPPPPKKARTKAPEVVRAEQKSEADALFLTIQLQNAHDASPIGPALRLASSTDSNGLQLLANKLTAKPADEEDEDSEQTPYSFSVSVKNADGTADTLRIGAHSLYDILKSDSKRLSVEDKITIICEPEAVFKVRNITRCSTTLTGHSAPILCASFSPTGRSLATGSGDNTIRLWDLDTELPKASLSGHTGWILCLEWDGMGRMLASGSMDNTVRLWDPKNSKALGEPLRGHAKWITALAWEPVHKNLETTRLATASKDGTVRVWQSKTRRTMFTLGGHTASVNSVKWGGQGLIYTASSDRTVKVWDDKEGKLVRTLSEHAHWVNTLALNTDFILRTGPYDHLAQKPVTDEQAQATALNRFNAFLAKNENAELLISGSDDHTLFLWPPQSASSAHPNPKKPLTRLTGHQKQVNHVAWSPDGRLVASAGFDNAVKVWDGKTGKFLSSLRGHVAAVYRLSWSSDSRMLVSASKDSTLKLWNIKTYKMKSDLPGHTDEVYCVDFVADKVVSGGKDKTVKIWKH